jgi:hypothetical protein
MARTTDTTEAAGDLPPIVRMLRDSLTVMDMATTDLWGLDRTMSVRDARSEMMDHHFDIAPLLPRPITCSVALATLKDIAGAGESIDEVAQVIDVNHLVSADLPLFDAVKALRERSFYFVIDRDRVAAIVTRADLQSASVGIAVLGLILGCEPLMNTLIQRSYGDEWPSKLTEPRMANVRDVYEARLRHNDDIGLLECLNLDDRLRLVSRSQTIRVALGFSRGSFDGWAKHLKGVRNALAHAGDILEAEADSLSAIDFFERLLDFSARLWTATASVDTHS